MIFDYFGNSETNGIITSLVNLLKETNNSQLWKYMGLKVEIDPTVDFNEQNVLIRWLDVEEGFNDRIIVHNIKEFYTNFTAI